MPMPSKETMLRNARALRKNMTPWERKLWYLFLRNYPVKIYKQQVIGPYIVDFCCPRAKLIIELDGSQHFMPDHRAADAERSANLEAHSYAILRIPNIDIDRRFQAVCETIDREIRGRTQALSQP